MSIHKSDEGTIFTITWIDGGELLDVSDALVRQVTFKHPNGGALLGPKTLSIPGGGEDGVTIYVFETGDLDTEGTWEWQGYIEFADGKFHADSGKFTVYPNLT